MLFGAILVLIGSVIRWKVSAYDLKDPAIDSAWTLARGKRTAANPTAQEAKYRDIQSQPSWSGKATKAAGNVAGLRYGAGAGRGGVSINARRTGPRRGRFRPPIDVDNADWPQVTIRTHRLHPAARMIVW
jgi:hypothetical protein